jgi:hypothetical protein
MRSLEVSIHTPHGNNHPIQSRAKGTSTTYMNSILDHQTLHPVVAKANSNTQGRVRQHSTPGVDTHPEMLQMDGIPI